METMIRIVALAEVLVASSGQAQDFRLAGRRSYADRWFIR